jgi:PII-like signaling protein
MEGKAKMMRIYIGESDRWKDKPLYQALVEARPHRRRLVVSGRSHRHICSD